MTNATRHGLQEEKKKLHFRSNMINPQTYLAGLVYDRIVSVGGNGSWFKTEVVKYCCNKQKRIYHVTSIQQTILPQYSEYQC